MLYRVNRPMLDNVCGIFITLVMLAAWAEGIRIAVANHASTDDTAGGMTIVGIALLVVGCLIWCAVEKALNVFEIGYVPAEEQEYVKEESKPDIFKKLMEAKTSDWKGMYPDVVTNDIPLPRNERHKKQMADDLAGWVIQHMVESHMDEVVRQIKEGAN